jgi:hypothetical protein
VCRRDPTLITIEPLPTWQAPRRPKTRVFVEGENQRPPALDLQEESRYEWLGGPGPAPFPHFGAAECMNELGELLS